MTVKELIEKLQTMPQDAPVILEIDDPTLLDRLSVYSEKDAFFDFFIGANGVFITAS